MQKWQRQKRKKAKGIRPIPSRDTSSSRRHFEARTRSQLKQILLQRKIIRQPGTKAAACDSAIQTVSNASSTFLFTPGALASRLHGGAPKNTHLPDRGRPERNPYPACCPQEHRLESAHREDV